MKGLMVERSRAVEISREFDAPRESVFEMWTDPVKLAMWWGPEGSMVTNCEIEPKPGGSMGIEERLPDGSIYPSTGTFSKVIEPELLVFRLVSPGAGGYPARETLNTVTFEKLGPRRTRVKVSVKVTVAPPDQVESLKQAFKAGWAESLKKLQSSLR